MKTKHQAPDGLRLRHALECEAGFYVNAIAWSPDGTFLAAAFRTGVILCWDTNAGKLQREIALEIGSSCGVAWSPRENKFAAASDAGVLVWNTRTWTLDGTIGQKLGTVWHLAYSPDGRFLALATKAGKCFVVDTFTGEAIREVDPKSHCYSACLAWSPDGTKLATTATVQVLRRQSDGRPLITSGGVIKVWNSNNWTLWRELAGEGGRVFCLAWSPDGKTLASASDDSLIRLWDPWRGAQTNMLAGHANAVHGISFSADERLLASCSWDNSDCLWRRDTWQQVFRLEVMSSDPRLLGIPLVGTPPTLAFNPTSPVLATAGESASEIRLWDVDAQKLSGGPPPFPLRVFLCHASEDKGVVEGLYHRLNGEMELDVWYDVACLLPGQDWEMEIRRAIKSSAVVIVCLSRGAVTKRGFVQKEISLALDAADEQPEGTVFVIPAKLEACEIPERLRKWQWVELFEEKGYAQMMKALRARAEDLPR